MDLGGQLVQVRAESSVGCAPDGGRPDLWAPRSLPVR
jgi:hypothetical protein